MQRNFSAFIPGFRDDLLLVSDFRQLPCRYFLRFLTFSTAAFATGIFHAQRIGINLCSKLQRLNEVIPFAEMWSSWYLCGTPSNRILMGSTASTTQKYMVLCFPILRQVFPQQFVGVRALLLASEFPIFYERFFMVCPNSSSFGSTKKIQRNPLALSSFGLSKAHVCFALLFAALDSWF